MAENKKGLSVLLIDDEVEFASTLAERLNLRNFSTHVVFDGETALACLEMEAFDLVLLDVMLPGMHGLDVLRRIRELRPETPVILMTGHSSTKDGITGMRQGAKSYLTKPIDLQELLSVFASLEMGAADA